MNLSRQDVTKYRQVAQVLREQIQARQVGDYLPSEHELARLFAVNRHTVRKALDILQAEGYVLRQQGRAARILPTSFVYPLTASSAYSSVLQGQGVQAQAQLLSCKKRSSLAEEARLLGLQESEDVTELTTLRLLDSQPVSVITHGFAQRHELTVAGYEGGSVRLHLMQQGLKLQRQATWINARMPSTEEASRLLMPRHLPVLAVRTLSCLPDGTPFEIARSVTRADRFTYHITSGEQHATA
jgi:GntR family phosphonate transport system transcriptional regulator